MKVTLLGCGTSVGVPAIGRAGWGACDPDDPRNRRQRCAVLVQTEATNVLVDAGPDIRNQLVTDVGSRINKNIGGLRLDKNSATLPAVSWVVRITRSPSGAADGRHTNRCSASEKRNLHQSPILEKRRRVLARVMAVMLCASVLRISASLARVWLV